LQWTPGLGACITAPTSAMGNVRIIHAELTASDNNLQLTQTGPRHALSSSSSILWTAPPLPSARHRAKGNLEHDQSGTGNIEELSQKGHNVHDAGVCVAGSTRDVAQKLTCTGRSLLEESQHAAR
jgi:hypothetical protein